MLIGFKIFSSGKGKLPTSLFQVKRRDKKEKRGYGMRPFVFVFRAFMLDVLSTNDPTAFDQFQLVSR